MIIKELMHESFTALVASTRDHILLSDVGHNIQGHLYISASASFLLMKFMQKTRYLLLKRCKCKKEHKLGFVVAKYRIWF